VNAAIHEEVGKQVGGFMEIMKSQPLSLALVIMNFLIVAYLFYSGAQQLEQRAQAMKMIVDWSKETDKILGNCVSIETMKLVVDALERDRELYRRMLPGQQGAAPPEGPKLQDSESRTPTPEEIENLFKMPP
jgi:hypothetical protein